MGLDRRSCGGDKVYKTLIAVTVPTEWKCRQKIKYVELSPSQTDMPWVAFIKKQSRYCLFPKLTKGDGSISDSYLVSNQAGTVWPMDSLVKEVLGFKSLAELHPRYSVNIVGAGGAAVVVTPKTRTTRSSLNRRQRRQTNGNGGQRHQNQKKKKQNQRKSVPPPRPQPRSPAPAQRKSPRIQAQQSPAGSKQNSIADAKDNFITRVQESSGVTAKAKRTLRLPSSSASPPVVKDADTVEVQKKNRPRISTGARARSKKSSNALVPLPQETHERSRPARNRHQNLGISPDITMLPLRPPQVESSRPTTRKLRSSLIDKKDQPKASPQSSRQARKRKASPSTTSKLPVKIPLIKSPPVNVEKLKPSVRLQMLYREHNLDPHPIDLCDQIEERTEADAAVAVAGPSNSSGNTEYLRLTLAIRNETENDRKQRNTTGEARAKIPAPAVDTESDSDSDSDLESLAFSFYKNPPPMDSDLIVATLPNLPRLPPHVSPQFGGGELIMPSRGLPTVTRVIQRPANDSNRPGIARVVLPPRTITVQAPCSSTSAIASTSNRNLTVTAPDAQTMFYHNCNKLTNKRIFESIKKELRSVRERGRWGKITREIPLTANFFALTFELPTMPTNYGQN